MQINDSCQRCRLAFFIISKKGKVCKTTLLNLENGFWYACTFGTETFAVFDREYQLSPLTFWRKKSPKSAIFTYLIMKMKLDMLTSTLRVCRQTKEFRAATHSEQGHIRIFFSVLSARHLQVWNSCRNRINDSMRQSAPYFFHHFKASEASFALLFSRYCERSEQLFFCLSFRKMTKY